MTHVFTERWCREFVNRWNEDKPEVSELAGAGAVLFRILDLGKERDVVLRWDDNGALSLENGLSSGEDVGLPMFEATTADWNHFIIGDFTAVEGVLRGRIKYRGPTRFALKYGEAFDEVAAVGRLVPRA